MKLQIRFILCAIIAMVLAIGATAQQPTPTPKNLLRGKQEIVQTGTNAIGDTVWGLKNPPARKAPLPAPPYINSFNSESDEINAGTAATLSFSVSGARTVTINGQDVTGDTELVVTPTTTTAYRLVATNAGGRVTEDLVIRVKPAPAPSSTDWGKLLNDWWWFIIFILLLVVAAYLLNQWLNHRRWREEQAAYAADAERYRQQEAAQAPQQQPQPSPFTFNQTINIGGGVHPTVATETAAPQPVAVAPEMAAAVTDPVSGEQATTQPDAEAVPAADTPSEDQPATQANETK